MASVQLALTRPATVTGVGSIPGTDPLRAAARVAEQLPDLPHVPELPDRGPGADMIGRTLALLADVAADFTAATTVTGWELTRASRDLRRARSMLNEDLDAVEQVWAGHRGLAKQQLAGPLTLAATVERKGKRLLADPGLVRELIHAWELMAQGHRAALTARVPATWLLQMDEPLLPAALQGTVRTTSGMSAYPAVSAALPQTDLLHCCAADLPWSRLPSTSALLLDFGLHKIIDDEPLADLISKGATMGFGVSGDAGSVRSVLEFYDRTGLVPEPVLITPPCGMVADYTHWLRVAEDLNGRWA